MPAGDGPGTFAAHPTAVVDAARICAGTWAGAGLITAADGAQASAALGAVLALYGVLGLTAVEFPVPGRLEPWLSPVIGMATGIDRGNRRLHDPVGSLLAGDRAREGPPGAGARAVVHGLDLGAGGRLARDGAFGVPVAGASLAVLAPALLGMALGQWLRARVRRRPSASFSSPPRCCSARISSCALV